MLKRTMLKGNFIEYRYLTIDLQKFSNIFCSQYIGKMVTHESYTNSSIFGTFYILYQRDRLCVQRVEKYEVNLTSRIRDPVYAYLPLFILLGLKQTKFTRQVNI